jgi:hypothetical protein
LATGGFHIKVKHALMRQLEEKERQQQRSRNYDFGNSTAVVSG